MSQRCLGLMSPLCLASAVSRADVSAGEGVTAGSERAVTIGPMGGNGANGAAGAIGGRESTVGDGSVRVVSEGAAGATTPDGAGELSTGGSDGGGPKGAIGAKGASSSGCRAVCVIQRRTQNK